mmetsp:Transcript_14109/g.27739  ORF Transcript_14109/g.27739 Transcript_14109/m.27739 type:complete len:112 (+) Transcript_14109:173-508(+)
MNRKPCFRKRIGKCASAVSAPIPIVELDPIHLGDSAAGAEATGEEVVEDGVLTATTILRDALPPPKFHPRDADEEDDDDLAYHAQYVKNHYAPQEPEDLMKNEESGEETYV